MPEKFCTGCGYQVTEESNACPVCGRSNLSDYTTASGSVSPAKGRASEDIVRLGLWRVGIVGLISLGWYLLYWFYITWKQLADETDERHYPLWHALGLLVPVYNLFVVAQHMNRIKRLAAHAGLSPALSPGLAVGLWLVIGALGLSSVWSNNVGMILILGGLGAISTASLLVWAQASLNQYWVKARGLSLSDRPIGIVEVLLVGLGLFNWVSFFRFP